MNLRKEVAFTLSLLFAVSLTIQISSAQPGNNAQAISLYNLGLTAYKEGQTDAAIVLFKQACDIDPDLFDGQYNLGLLFQSQKRLQEALPRFEQVLRVKPNDSDAHYQLALCLENMGRIEEARQHFASIPNNTSHFADAQKEIVRLDQQLPQAPPRTAIEATQPPRQPAAAVQKQQAFGNDTPIADKWALVIGISNFANPQYNLKYAAKDAQDFYNYLVSEGNFKTDHVLLLLNENATRRNIMAAFGDKFLPAVTRDGDLVAIYVSTHGTPASKDPGKRNFIVAYDTEADALYETGVDMDELYRRVKEGVRTDRALIVMDTCYSGAGVPGARGMDEFGNFDAAQIAQGFGHLVMSSSSPSERSWESKVSANGVFTKYLLQDLRLTGGNVKHAFDKLKEDVGWEVQNAFNQPQHPQLGGDWQGKELIISATAHAPRAILNPDLLKLINLQTTGARNGRATKGN